MRFKLLFVALLFCNIVYGQDVYTYKGLAITAAYNNVPLQCDSDVFIYMDSLVRISINMYERSVSDISVKNLSNKPIFIKWKRVSAYNQDTDFFSCANTYFIDSKTTDEDKLYKDEIKSYILNNCIDQMFSKRKKNQRGGVHVAVVVDDRLIDYRFQLSANPIK